jgi:hypothetical protein
MSETLFNFEHIRNAMTNSAQMNSVFEGFNQGIIDDIERYVPLQQNPNRTIDMSGNLIKVVTCSGSIYCFEVRPQLTCFPIYFNHTRIRVSTTDSSGNTISNLNGQDLYRIDLQGNVLWRNQELLDLSGNNIDNINYINYDSINNSIYNNIYNNAYYSVTGTSGTSINMFSGAMIRKKIIEDNICPIRFEPIEEYDIYMNCTCCKKNFFEDELRQWLLPKSLQNKTCPNCRSQWSDYNMYINRV